MGSLEWTKALKSYADIVIIVPLKEELERLKNEFPVVSDKIDGTSYSCTLDTGNPNVRVVAFLQDDMGKAAATRAARNAIGSYDIGVIIVFGIAGGISGDVGIGDIAITGNVIDILENAKISDSKDKGVSIEYATQFRQTDRLLTFAIRSCTLSQEFRDNYERWQLEQLYKAERLVPGEFIGRNNRNERVSLPKVHDGAIVCGSVSKSEIYKGSLKSIDRKILAVETEAGGVFYEAEDAQIPCIAIRGICDYSDENKNKLEEQTSGQTRNVAADNSLTFIRLQLSNDQFLNYLRKRSESYQTNAAATQDVDPTDYLAGVLDTVRTDIHHNLGNLSPEYQSKPLGYRLPLPRLRRAPINAEASRVLHSHDPIQILDAIITDPVLVINLPRSYPDNALPWVIASEIQLIHVDGLPAVPIVIGGDEIRPPKGSIESATHIDVKRLAQRNDARCVFILTDFDVNSSTRVAFLTSEIKKYPNARFVVINRNDDSVAGMTELASKSQAIAYNVCTISFIEMAEFFRRSFHMPEQEAGVIALRLSEMFKRFDLNAHPSYFANVAGEVIGALLRANRRAELLQIAVGAFLSFVVDADVDDVRLSRTTREAFLRLFAFERRVEKRNFSRAELITLVEGFSDKKDYGIDPIKFIAAFQSRGILHFGIHGAEISLPFIESYLLACELASRPDDAKKYFDLDSDDFDFATFDVYGEIGPADAVIQSVNDRLDRMVGLFPIPAPEGHILLSDKFRPAVTEKTSRLKVLEDRLEKAFEDVTSGRANSVEKQRLLDLASRVEGSAREAQEEARAKNADSEKRNEDLYDGFRIWAAATVLLGSGSERLDREPKRELVGKISKLTSALLDAAMRAFPQAEFDEFKKRFESEAVVREIFEIDESLPVDSNLVDFVSTIVDAYEFSLLGSPLRSMLSHLGNVAGQPVLRNSIGRIASDDMFERLIAKIWSAEINAVASRHDLIEEIKKLPHAAFLRVSLSTHFMTRVYWNQWDHRNRIALLDAAEEVLRPLKRTFDKGRLQRMIASEAKEAPSTKKL